VVPQHTRISLGIWLVAQCSHDLWVEASSSILPFFIPGGVPLS
jgi:hypothetical protein